jgi:hypothetical protein
MNFHRQQFSSLCRAPHSPQPAILLSKIQEAVRARDLAALRRKDFLLALSATALNQTISHEKGRLWHQSSETKAHSKTVQRLKFQGLVPPVDVDADAEVDV